MELQMHSPTMWTLPKYATKRARSPDSPSATSRPLKRLVTNLPSLTASGFTSVAGSVNGTTSRLSSEDWVQQAGGLRIDSPSSRTPGGVDVDADMTENMEANINVPRAPIPLPASPQASPQCSPSQIQHDLEYERHQREQFTSSSVSSMGQRSMHNALQLDLHAPPEETQSQFSRPSPTATRPPSPMSMSPSTSWNEAFVPSTQLRKRPTMGPRADCEKCRLGVKGHWMHF